MTDQDSNQEFQAAIDRIWNERSSEILDELDRLVTMLDGLAAPGTEKVDRLTAGREAHRLVGVLGVFGRHESSRSLADIERLLLSDDDVDATTLRVEAIRIAAQVRGSSGDDQTRR